VRAEEVKRLAGECGFELCGIARADALPEYGYYRDWVAGGMAGEMTYLTDRRAALRETPASLLASARSVIVVGKLYNGPQPSSTRFDDRELAWISRYAWGGDYHHIVREGLERLAGKLAVTGYKICVDTAPLLERALARHAGLGWIGKNTCLINQGRGSWFFLGELLVPLALETGAPPPDRCGTCTRCVDACPTQAIVPTGRPQGPAYALDARLCISYLTIELQGSIPEELRPGVGRHVLGCDICQDVCPWNRKAPVTSEGAFEARHVAPPLEKLAALREQEFQEMFRGTPVLRAKYSGFLRNVAVAMGNSGLPRFRPALERLAASPDRSVAEHANWALERLRAT
jgi:epoxyqueuosine reductase